MINHQKNTEWLSALGLTSNQMESLFILHGENPSDISTSVNGYEFPGTMPVKLPGDYAETVFVGIRDGMATVCAIADGVGMATYLVHLFGAMGTRRVFFSGTCRGLSHHVNPGDLFLAVEAYSGEGVSAHYQPADPLIAASYEGPELRAIMQHKELVVHWGRVYSTDVPWILAQDQFTECFRQQCWAVDAYTAAIYAAARHLNMKRMALLSVLENPVYDSEKETSHECRRKRLEHYHQQRLRLACELTRVNTTRVKLS